MNSKSKTKSSKKCETVTVKVVSPKVPKKKEVVTVEVVSPEVPKEQQFVTVHVIDPKATERKTANVQQIKVGKRFRNDVGDLTDLKSSIDAIGLLHPIVVDQDNILITGLRRLAAFKELNLPNIPVTVVDINDPIRAECDENVERKDFTPSEATAIWEDIQSRQGKRTDLCQNQAEVEDRRKKASKIVGRSPDTLSKAKQVVDFGDKEIIQEMDESNNVNAAYKKLKRIKRQKERKIVVPDGVKPPTIIHGDFKDNDIADNSIDLITTDPLYSKEDLPSWDLLAKESVRVLKPGGFLVTYSGHYYLPEVINALLKHLSYYWVCALIHKGQLGSVPERRMRVGFKPILIFYKPPIKHPEHLFTDTITGDKPDKDFHPYGQGVGAVIELINHFSKPGDTVLDPFMGGGMTIEAATKCEEHRNVIGYEIKKEYYDLVKERLENNQANNGKDE